MRVPESIDVQFKLLSKLSRFQDDTIYDGSLIDIDRQNAIVAGPLPDRSWIPALTDGKVLLGMNVFLPTSSVALKILTEVERVEPNPDGEPGAAEWLFVCNFREISPDHHRRMIRFIVSLYVRRSP